jgi:hypothetical protein
MSADVPNIETFAAVLGRKHNDPLLARLTMNLGTAVRRVVEHLTYLDYTNKGISFIFDKDGCLEAIFLFSDGYEGYAAFSGRLPAGIAFGETSDKVRSKLGDPIETGGGKIGILGKVIPFWEQYVCGGFRLTVQYNAATRGVDLVTILGDS